MKTIPACPRVLPAVLLAATAAAQGPAETWFSNSMNVGQTFAGVNLVGPAGFGLIAASFGWTTTPATFPFGQVWLGSPSFTIAAGATSAGAPMTLWFSIPADPSLLNLPFAAQGAVLPSSSPGTILLANATATRVGPMLAIAPPASHTGQLFGRSLAVGDRNGDGLAELAVGAPGARDASASVAVGTVAVYGGAPLGLVQYLYGAQGGASFGNAVALAQVDGTSGLDLIVGEPMYDLGPTETDSGRVHVFYAPGYTSGTTLSLGAPAGAALQHLGFEVLGADLDGDGHASVIAAAPALGSAASKVHVFDWSAGVIGLSYSLVNPTGTSGEFGRALAAGDLWAGGAKELAVGDRSYAPAMASNRGRVYLYLGGMWLLTLESPTPTENGFYGHALAIGDLTGDGIADLAVGAPGESKVYLYAGGPSGPAAAPTLTLLPPAGAWGIGASGFGQALAIADADGNGSNDLVVGQLGAGGVGSAIVHLGTTGAGNSFQLRALFADQDTFANLYGTAFAVGDTDGLGGPELFGGAPTKTVDWIDAGRVFQARL